MSTAAPRSSNGADRHRRQRAATAAGVSVGAYSRCGGSDRRPDHHQLGDLRATTRITAAASRSIAAARSAWSIPPCRATTPMSAAASRCARAARSPSSTRPYRPTTSIFPRPRTAPAAASPTRGTATLIGSTISGNIGLLRRRHLQQRRPHAGQHHAGRQHRGNGRRALQLQCPMRLPPGDGDAGQYHGVGQCRDVRRRRRHRQLPGRAHAHQHDAPRQRRVRQRRRRRQLRRRPERDQQHADGQLRGRRRRRHLQRPLFSGTDSPSPTASSPATSPEAAARTSAPGGAYLGRTSAAIRCSRRQRTAGRASASIATDIFELRVALDLGAQPGDAGSSPTTAGRCRRSRS